MVHAVVVAHRQLEQVVGQILRVGGVAQLVVHHLQLSELFARRHHGLYKVFARRAVQPGGAHDKIAAAEIPHVFLAQGLGLAVHADGRGPLALVQRAAAVRGPAEHIVGGNVDQPRADLLGRLRQICRSHRVHLKSRLRLFFAAVHIGKGRAADDGVRLVAPHKGDGFQPVGNVQLAQVGGDHAGVFQPLGHGPQGAAAPAQLALQLGAQLPLRAGNEYFHAFVLLAQGVNT